MATPSVSNTLIDGQTIQPGPLNQNFADIVTGLSTGTWDFNIGALTVAGTMSVGGNTTLGNNAADTITMSGTVNSDIVPYSATAYTLGTTTLPWKAVALGGLLATGTTMATNVVYGNGIVRAWGNIGSMATIIAGFNINAAARSATGIYTITIANGFNSVDFVAVGSVQASTVAETLTCVPLSSSTVKMLVRAATDGALGDYRFSFVSYGG